MLEREVHVRHGLRLDALCRVVEQHRNLAKAARIRDTAQEMLTPKNSHHYRRSARLRDTSYEKMT